MTAKAGFPPTIHASTVVIGGKGVLIRGLPRSGKTTLGQALIAHAGETPSAQETVAEAATSQLAMWVSDDRTIVEHDGTGLVARPPAAIAGRIADRRRGILSVPHAASAALSLIVDLDLLHDHPGPAGSARLLDETLPLLRFPCVTPDNVAELTRHVLTALGLAQEQG